MKKNQKIKNSPIAPRVCPSTARLGDYLSGVYLTALSLRGIAEQFSSKLYQFYADKRSILVVVSICDL